MFSTLWPPSPSSGGSDMSWEFKSSLITRRITNCRRKTIYQFLNPRCPLRCSWKQRLWTLRLLFRYQPKIAASVKVKSSLSFPSRAQKSPFFLFFFGRLLLSGLAGGLKGLWSLDPAFSIQTAAAAAVAVAAAHYSSGCLSKPQKYIYSSSLSFSLCPCCLFLFQ